MQILELHIFKLCLVFQFSGCLMEFCYKLLVCEFRHSYCSENMFPNFAYARCATGFETRSGKEIPVQTSPGAIQL